MSCMLNAAMHDILESHLHTFCPLRGRCYMLVKIGIDGPDDGDCFTWKGFPFSDEFSGEDDRITISTIIDGSPSTNP